MEKDHDKQSHWITLAPGMVIQALLTEKIVRKNPVRSKQGILIIKLF
jgi:hypothetical protein